MQESTGLEIAKGRELKARFLELKEKQQRRQREAGEIEDEHKGAMITSQALEDQKKALEEEKMALDRHAQVLTQQNKAIESEMESFICIDEQV